MLTTKNLSLVEQKKIQWAKEKEEMMGLYGLWGKPKNNYVQKNQEVAGNFGAKSNVLPPILTKNNNVEHVKASELKDESETSGYLSDSPKCINRLQCKEPPEKYQFLHQDGEFTKNEEICEENQKNYWSESEKGECYWAEKKVNRNYTNENWIQRPQLQQQQQQHGIEYPDAEYDNSKMLHSNNSNNNYWYGTPESVSSDDGNRLRWGDRGIGVGHFWDPIINPPIRRLPQMNDQYRHTPKWVEKGLKNHYENQSEVLIINHPNDDSYNYNFQKNFILGQNAPIPLEVIEERELKRKKALEHQNAIKKQLEEKAIKRQQEKERRQEEEKLEEERIRKEREIERLRYEEEQWKIKEKEEVEKKKEKAMKEAIEIAEKRAREEKKKKKSQISEEERRTLSSSKEKFSKIEKIMQPTEMNLLQNKKNKKLARREESENFSNLNNRKNRSQDVKNEKETKTLKDCSSQFEDITLTSSFKVLNVNGFQVDKGLALMLDNPSNEGNILLPPEGVQLALLMSPRNQNAENQFLPLSPSFSESAGSCSIERTLTPSKYRLNRPSFSVPLNKSTQTDFRHSSKNSVSEFAVERATKVSLKRGTQTGFDFATQKSNNVEKSHKHSRCHPPSRKYWSKHHFHKLDDRPKWGINRPSVQYKTQSEKDPNYHKRMKEKIKNNKMEATTLSDQTIRNEEEEEDDDEDDTIEEKELNSVVRLLKLRDNERDHSSYNNKIDVVLENGFRMNSNLSSPVFVPIENWNKNSNRNGNSKKLEMESEESFFDTKDGDESTETEEEQPIQSAVEGKMETCFNSLQLEAIEKISNLRECIKNLQKDYSNSRNSTPFSEKNLDQ